MVFLGFFKSSEVKPHLEQNSIGDGWVTLEEEEEEEKV
jgi:hypothetical protein